MKFKTASILGLIIPLSIALMLTAFLGCGGGGGAYGNSTQAYDGTWYFNLKGYSMPAPAAGATVSCAEVPATIVITHGSGTVTQQMICHGSTPDPYPEQIDIGVTLTPDPLDATGKMPITGTVTLIVTGGGPTPSSGICANREQCTAGPSQKGLTMYKCGTVVASPYC